jgi:hypothetical protein
MHHLSSQLAVTVPYFLPRMIFSRNISLYPGKTKQLSPFVSAETDKHTLTHEFELKLGRVEGCFHREVDLMVKLAVLAQFDGEFRFRDAGEVVLQDCMFTTI